jgi:hypothetical protein
MAVVGMALLELRMCKGMVLEAAIRDGGSSYHRPRYIPDKVLDDSTGHCTKGTNNPEKCEYQGVIKYQALPMLCSKAP